MSCDNKWIWKAKMAHEFILSRDQPSSRDDSVWPESWEFPAIPRALIFEWKLLPKRLSTSVRLAHWVWGSLMCVICVGMAGMTNSVFSLIVLILKRFGVF